jgi:hypothetical protein
MKRSNLVILPAGNGRPSGTETSVFADFHSGLVLSPQQGRFGKWQTGKTDWLQGANWLQGVMGFRFALPFVKSSRTGKSLARIQLCDTENQSVYVSLNLNKDTGSAWSGFLVTKNKVTQFFQKIGTLAQERLQFTREEYQLDRLDHLTVLDTQRICLSVPPEYSQLLPKSLKCTMEMEFSSDSHFQFTNFKERLLIALPLYRSYHRLSGMS